MIVVALDPPFGPDGLYSLVDMLEKTKDLAYGYKVGLPLILDRGIEVVSNIKRATGLEVIVDLKLADIGEVMVSTARRVYERGADAVIAHGFVGVKDALDKLVEESKRLGRKVILVASMTHTGSTQYIDKHFEEIVKDAIDLSIHGIVVPATRPTLVKLARSIAGDRLKIYSPGIGAQGAEPGTALCEGADFEIIGRSITRAPDPRASILDIYEKMKRRLRSCGGYRENYI